MQIDVRHTQLPFPLVLCDANPNTGIKTPVDATISKIWCHNEGKMHISITKYAFLRKLKIVSGSTVTYHEITFRNIKPRLSVILFNPVEFRPKTV